MTMKNKNLEGLLVDLLKDLYSAEKQIVEALPKMASATKSKELKTAFESHLGQTHQHIERLEQVFEDLNGKPGGKKCIGMEALIKEGYELMGEEIDPETMDAGLIAAAQKVEHYEMAGYGTARTFAKTLGYKDSAILLQTTLDEEAAADEKLTRMAEFKINERAVPVG